MFLWGTTNLSVTGRSPEIKTSRSHSGGLDWHSVSSSRLCFYQQCEPRWVFVSFLVCLFEFLWVVFWQNKPKRGNIFEATQTEPMCLKSDVKSSPAEAEWSSAFGIFFTVSCSRSVFVHLFVSLCSPLTGVISVLSPLHFVSSPLLSLRLLRSIVFHPSLPPSRSLHLVPYRLSSLALPSLLLFADWNL